MIKLNIKKEFDLYIDSSIDGIIQLKSNLSEDKIQTIIKKIINCFDKNGKLIFCGNGGSASDSQHLAAEFIGRYKLDRKPLPAIALNTDTSVLTALSNDLGYAKVFERQIEALANENDILFAISTSGKSINVINAVNAAKRLKVFTICFTGAKNNKLSDLTDISINVPAEQVNHIQEMHIMVGHFICELVEKHYQKNN
tara:strand:- start:526 stop:1119 length:594 start_codon:yes stop_codon:yes gene_type:complete